MNADEDLFADLRSPTHIGTPKWDVILEAIKKLDRPLKLGVFPCGDPQHIMGDLRMACTKYSRQGPKVKLGM